MRILANLATDSGPNRPPVGARTPAGLRAVIQRCLAKEPDQRYQHAAEAEKVLDLELGPEDYVTKPFSPRELRARIKTALRRTEYRFDD